MIGFQLDKKTIDSQLGSMAADLRARFGHLEEWKTRLIDGMTDQQWLDMGYTATDRDDSKALVLAWYTMVQVIYGRQSQTPANNFMFLADKAAGLA